MLKEKAKSKKRLCVFYFDAASWIDKKIEWIVCKECQRMISRGIIPVLGLEK